MSEGEKLALAEKKAERAGGGCRVFFFMSGLGSLLSKKAVQLGGKACAEEI